MDINYNYAIEFTFYEDAVDEEDDDIDSFDMEDMSYEICGLGMRIYDMTTTDEVIACPFNTPCILTDNWKVKLLNK